MRISKDQLKQIIQEELQAVLSEARVPLALRESDTADMFKNMGVKQPDTWKYLDPADKLPDPFADVNAKKVATKKVAKKGMFSGLGKFLGRVAAGPVGMAVTGAEIAGHAIDMGVGGVDAKIGKARASLGGSEEDAYNLWAADKFKKKGEESPSYEQYLRVQNASDRQAVAKQVKAEMEQP